MTGDLDRFFSDVAKAYDENVTSQIRSGAFSHKHFPAIMAYERLPKESGAPRGNGTCYHPHRQNEAVMVYCDGEIFVSDSFVRDCANGTITANDYAKIYPWPEDEQRPDPLEELTPEDILHGWLFHMMFGNITSFAYVD